jgi:predicted transposase YdaD
MAGKWDSNFKHLVEANPEHFIEWLLPGAHYVRELNTHLNRGIDIDILYEVIFQRIRILVHLEFQRYEDAEIDKRVLEYNVFASCKFDCPVVSFVIYLKKESKVVEPPLIRELPDGKVILRFDFINIKLWEIPTDELRKIGLVGVLPLLSLTREGGTPEVVQEAIDGIEGSALDSSVKASLLAITFTLASLALTRPESLEWLRRRYQMYKDILRDTEIYQLIMQEGEEKEHLKRLQDQQQVLLGFVQARFPDIVSGAAKQIPTITDIEVLKHLTLKVGLASSSEEARRLLLTAADKAEN